MKNYVIQERSGKAGDTAQEYRRAEGDPQLTTTATPPPNNETKKKRKVEFIYYMTKRKIEQTSKLFGVTFNWGSWKMAPKVTLERVKKQEMLDLEGKSLEL